MTQKLPRGCGLWKFLMLVWLAAVWPEGVRGMQTFAFMSGGHNPRMMHSLRYNPKVCKLSSRSQGRYEDGCKRARSSSLSMKNTGGGKDLIQELQSQIAGLTRSLQQFLSNGTGLIFPAVFVLLLVTGQVKWVFDIFNFIFLLVFILPVVLVIALNLWVKTSVVDGECPNCGSRVMLAKKSQSLCMTCGTPLLVENGKVSRVSVYNTRTDTRTGKQTVVDVVDVEAIDVDSKEK
mmetsp:Transcript_13191/g.30324  ORF Transcript_13191/g.30324 Transcript_13191/m.30324 type:complete len:234 (-) Transcript_13191:160-861(-)